MEGWRCPSCGACYAPFVDRCYSCKGHALSFTGAERAPIALCPGCASSPCRANSTACRSLLPEPQLTTAGSDTTTVVTLREMGL